MYSQKMSEKKYLAQSNKAIRGKKSTTIPLNSFCGGHTVLGMEPILQCGLIYPVRPTGEN